MGYAGHTVITVKVIGSVFVSAFSEHPFDQKNVAGIFGPIRCRLSVQDLPGQFFITVLQNNSTAAVPENARFRKQVIFIFTDQKPGQKIITE